MITWYASIKGTPMQEIPNIQARVNSDAAALIAVMDAPMLSAEATTRFGNIDAASRATNARAAVDSSTKAGRSESFRSMIIEATIAASTMIAQSQRRMLNWAVISGWMMKCP